jgi:hypothetical protein
VVKLNNPLRSIQRIADWLDDRKATRQVRKVNEDFAPKVAAAKKEQKWEERDQLLSDWQFETDAALDPLYARKAGRLGAKARKYDISVPPKPGNPDESSEDWILSNTTGQWLLTQKAEERLRREIKIERRASYDELRKWATLVFAVFGFALGLASLLAKEKRPDPCAQNYYRNDSGECVFVIQKVMTQLPQAAPQPSSVQETRSVPCAPGDRRDAPRQDQKRKTAVPKKPAQP